jgi:cytochrome c
MMRGISCLLVASVMFVACTAPSAPAQTEPSFAVLVFSKTSAFRHDSIPQGIAAVKALGAGHGFFVDTTEDPWRFTDAELARYRVVVFLNTTGDILDDGQKAAFERYIRSGGGFVGVHSASDTEYGWAWYGRLVGAYFASHPAIQPATVHVEDLGHASTEGLPARWERTDEWYNFRSNPRDRVHVLATVDEASYSGGTMGADHPIAWCQEIDGGRSWYTAMGHTRESYTEPLYRLHLLGGIESAAGVADGCSARVK